MQEAHGHQCGKTSRTTRSLTSQLSTHTLITKICNDAIPWEEIGVIVDEVDVPKLDTILTSIPPKEILRKLKLLANPALKRAVVFPQPAQPGDGFHQILNVLAHKLPHDKSIYLKPGEKILNWTDGPVEDQKPW